MINSPKIQKASLILSVCINISLQFGFAQAQIHTQIESECNSSNGQSPFWFTNNRQGISTLKNENDYLKAGLFREMNDTSKFDYQLGLDIVEAQNYPSSFFIQQLYGDIRYKKFIFSLGSKERWGILKNPELSSGGLSWSGNARPIPQARLETNGYLSYPWLLNNQLKVNAALSYGIFSDYQFIKRTAGSSINNVFYHNKTLILQYDIPQTQWSTSIGLESHSQFGGYRKDLKQFLLITIQAQGDSKSSKEDKLYMIGSSRGSWHIMPTYHTNNYNLSVYLENFFEDFSGMAKQNRLDGIWGLEYKRTDKKQGISGIVLEYLQTTDQSGPVNWVIHDHPGTQLLAESPKGNDGYYKSEFNGIWAHWGMINGNPLLTSSIYNNYSTVVFNNRVKAFHFGISALFNKEWSTKIISTYTRGWGTYDKPFNDITNDYMSLVELHYTPLKLKNWRLTIAGALDRGDLYGNNTGISLKLRYRR
ncbi:capsule assembly Wzi family protein [Parabacteroides sp. FAFU027]|uniref:capsule assembly Wzi family protein n=1 Tax=Parabacteroides sp. FAFU027 TaxID=2922715 RepID=UPI001FB01204|nr:capsule assembly Wzi family protein [Parabacteroides sp. FAFU027]